MDLIDAIRGRRSIRSYLHKPVSLDLMKSIIDAGIHAPSTCNQEMYAVIIVDDPRIKKRLETDAGFKMASRFPNLLFVICDKRFGNERFANIQSAAASIQNMLLYAYSLGIGSCWMCGYGDKALVKQLLNIPSSYHVLGAVGFGYPDERPIPPLRRSVDDITFFNRFEEKNKGNNPDCWHLEDIHSLSARSIYAKSPDIGYNPLFKLELDQEITYISTKLGETILSVYDISGLYLFELAKHNPTKKFTSLVTHKKIKEWMDERAHFLGLTNLQFFAGDLRTVKKTYDTLLCLDLVNRIPHLERGRILSFVKRLLHPNGRVILSALNKFSFYGFFFRNGVSRRYGPEISLSMRSIKTLAHSTGLRVVERRGFNLIPSFRLFFKMGVHGRYTFFY